MEVGSAALLRNATDEECIERLDLLNETLERLAQDPDGLVAHLGVAGRLDRLLASLTEALARRADASKLRCLRMLCFLLPMPSTLGLALAGDAAGQMRDALLDVVAECEQAAPCSAVRHAALHTLAYCEPTAPCQLMSPAEFACALRGLMCALDDAATGEVSPQPVVRAVFATLSGWLGAAATTHDAQWARLPRRPGRRRSSRSCCGA